MARYNINDIHSTLSNAFGDEFNVDVNQFTRNFQTDSNFRSASYEAMASIEDDFDQETVNLLELDYDNPIDPPKRYNAKGEVVTEGGMTAGEYFRTDRERRTNKRYNKLNYDFWDSALQNPEFLDLDVYDLGREHDRGLNRFFRLNKERYYDQENPKYNQTLDVKRTNDGLVGLLNYGKERFGTTSLEYYQNVNIFGDAIEKAAETYNSLADIFEKPLGQVDQDSQLFSWYSENSDITSKYSTFGEFKENIPQIAEELNSVSFNTLPEVTITDGSSEVTMSKSQQIQFNGTIQEAIDAYNNIAEDTGFKDHSTWSQYVVKYAEALEDVEERNPLYFEAIARSAEKQQRIDEFNRIGGMFPGLIEGGYVAGKALELIQGGASIVDALLNQFDNGGYGRFDAIAENVIDVLDNDNYAYTGTASKFKGQMFENVVEVNVGGSTYTVVYEDSSAKEVLYYRDSDGFMLNAPSAELVKQITSAAKGIEPQLKKNSKTTMYMFADTLFDVTTMIAGGYANSATKLGGATARFTAKGTNRIRRVLGVGERQIDDLLIKQISRRQGAEMTMAMQMHNDMYQNALSQDLTPQQAAFHSLGGTIAVVTVNRLNPEYDMFYKAADKVSGTEIQSLLAGLRNRDIVKQGFSKYMPRMVKGGFTEAFEEGFFEPLGQDFVGTGLAQLGGGQIEMQSFTKESMEGLMLGGSVGVIFPMANIVSTNFKVGHLQKDILYRMYQNKEQSRSIINGYVGNLFLGEDGKPREFTKADADKFIRILERAEAMTDDYVNASGIRANIDKGSKKLTDAQALELHSLNIGISALQEVESTPQIQETVDEVTANLTEMVNKAKQDPSTLDALNNDPTVETPGQIEQQRRAEDELDEGLKELGLPTSPKTKPHVRALAKTLEQNFPGTTAVTAQSEFDKIFTEKVMVQFPTLNQENKNKVKGFYDDATNTIYLNPESATLGTAVHEFTHVWLNYVKANNTDLYNKMLDLAKNDAGIMSLVGGIAEYNTEDIQAMEAIVHAIENRAELALTAENAPSLNKLLKFIQEMFDYLRKTLNLTDKPFEQYTLQEFVDRGAYEVLTGDMSSGIAVPTVNEMVNERVIMRDARGQYAVGDLEVSNGNVGLRQNDGTFLNIGSENILYDRAHNFGLEFMDGTSRRVKPVGDNVVEIDGVESVVSLSVEERAVPSVESNIKLAIAADISMLSQARDAGLLFHGTMEESLDTFFPRYRAGTYGSGLYFTNAAYKAKDYGNYFVFSNPENMNLLPYYDTKFGDLLPLMSGGKFKSAFAFLSNLTKEQAENIKAAKEKYFGNTRFGTPEHSDLWEKANRSERGLGGTAAPWVTDAAIYFLENGNFDYGNKNLSGLSLHDLTMFTYNGTSFGGMETVRQGLSDAGIDGWYVSSDISKYHEAVVINNEKINQSLVDNPFEGVGEGVRTETRISRLNSATQEPQPSLRIDNPLAPVVMKNTSIHLSVAPSVAAKIGVAPFRSIETLTLGQVNEVHETPQFKYLQTLTGNLANALGITVGDLSPSHGGYTFMGNDAGRFLQEASQFVEIQGDPEAIKVFAAVLGAIAPDQQESVVRFTEVDDSVSSEDAPNFYMQIPIPANILGSDGNEEASQNFRTKMYEAGIQGFSITYGNNLLHLFPENDQEVEVATDFLVNLSEETGTDLTSGMIVTKGKRDFDEEESDQGGYLETIRGFRGSNPELQRTNPDLHNILAFAETSYLREQGFRTKNAELISTPLNLTWDDEISDFRVGGLSLNQYGKKYGVENLGGVSETVSVQMAPGLTWNIPGGIEEGTFTFAELFWMKQQGWNPALVTNEKNRVKLYNKLARTMTPEKGDSVSAFNGFIFGLLSPNQPLTPNEFQVAVGRVQASEDAESDELIRQYFTGEIESLTAEQVPVLTIQGYANMLAGVADPLNMSQEERLALEDKITLFFQAQAADKGGLGIKSSGEYTNVAELAYKFRMASPIEGQVSGAEFFQKSPNETWVSFMTRMMTEVRGLAAKTASFSSVWQDPLTAAISAMDRHMLRVFEPELLANSADRAKFEGSLINKWNNAVRNRDQFQGKKRSLADKKKYIENHDFVTAESTEVTNLDEMMSQRGANQAFMMTMFALVGEKKAQYELKKTGAINPRYEQFVGKYNQLLTPPKEGKVSLPGDFYLKALTINDARAQENGLSVFMSQWALWDKKRNRFEPHEIMFPGLAKLPRLPFFTIQESIQSHKNAGYMNSTMDENMNMNAARPMSASGLYFSIEGDSRAKRVVQNALDKGMEPQKVKQKLIEAGYSPETANNLVFLGVRDAVDMPKERMTASTWAKIIPDDRTTEEITDNVKTYFPRSNAMTSAEAKILLDEVGLPSAIRMLIEPDRVNLLFQDKKTDAPSSADPIPSRKKQGRKNTSANAQTFKFSAVRVALFNEVKDRISGMIEELDANGDNELAENYRSALRDMVSGLAQDATNAGQFIQAFSLLSRSGGETLVAYVTRKLGDKGITLTDDDIETLTELGDRMKAFQDNTQEFVRAEFEMLKYIARLEGVTLFDIAEAQLYANMLSGFGTQIKNFAANIASILTEGIVLPMSTLSGSSFIKYWRGVFKGMRPAMDEAFFTIKTGIRYERGVSDKYAIETSRVPLYEMYGFNQLWGDDAYVSNSSNKLWQATETILGRAMLQIFNPVFLKWPGRMLSAVDIGMRQMSKGGEVAVIMHRLAQGKDTDAMSQEELATLEQQALNIVLGEETAEERAERREKYGVQAVEEGYTPGTNAFRLRTAELEQQEIAVRDIESEASRIATENIFMNEPAGQLGRVYRGVLAGLETDKGGQFGQAAARSLKALFVPFLKVLANVGNRLYSYTPMQLGNIAIDRAMVAMGKAGEEVYRNQDSRRRAYARATFGTAVMAFMYAGMKQDDEDEEYAWVVTGGGTGDRNKDYQLQMDGNWKPYTVTFYRPFRGGPLYDTPKTFEYRESVLSLVFMGLGAMNDYERFVREGLVDDSTAWDDVMSKTTIAIQAFLTGLTEYTFVQGLQEAFKGIPESGSRINKKGDIPFQNYLGKKAEQTAKSITVPNFIQQINRSALDMMDKPLNQRLEILDNWKREMLMFDNETNHPLVDVLGDPVQPDASRYFSFISEQPGEEATDYEREYFYETFVSNNCFIGTPSYPGVVDYNTDSPFFGRNIPYTAEQEYKFYVLRGAKIKDILYKVSEHGLLELTEDAIEEFVEVSNNGMINVNVLAEQTKTDVLQKVLNYIVREASKYATSYIQAEHSVISLNEKDFSTGLTDEEREKLNASLSLLEDIGKSSSLWPPTLASRSDEKPTVGDIFEY